ncbi:hypothetical protein E0F70_11235, partial [Streptococcus dysgalactiae]|uniref:hypothetical protein n=1 Tax=Streptococcus dysgalactiae TaxID=1334 RepID=UPI00128655A4
MKADLLGRKGKGGEKKTGVDCVFGKKKRKRGEGCHCSKGKGLKGKKGEMKQIQGEACFLGV